MRQRSVVSAYALTILMAVASCRGEPDGPATDDVRELPEEEDDDEQPEGAGAGRGGAGGRGGAEAGPGGTAGEVAQGGAGMAPDAGAGGATATVTVDAGLGGMGGGTGASVCPSLPANAVPWRAQPQPVLVRKGFAFLEGPVWVAPQDALYVSEFRGTGTDGRIHRYDPVGNAWRVLVDGVGTNGLAWHPDGFIVAASHDMQRITKFDPATGKREAVPGAATYMGQPFNSVNDLTVHPNGTIYFTDPSYQRGSRAGQPATATYRLSPAGAVTLIATLEQPNGVTLSPDARTLYVAARDGRIVAFSVRADGSIEGMGRTFARPGFGDGMAMDCAGNLYVGLYSDRAVAVFGPDGSSRGRITGFAGNVTNAAFGGRDRRTLFVTTAAGELYRVPLEIPGFPD